MEHSVATPQLLRMQQVIRSTGLARSTIYKLIARREFPAPIKLTRKSVGWPLADIERWIATRRHTQDG
jgi:prophage regulatory protein